MEVERINCKPGDRLIIQFKPVSNFSVEEISYYLNRVQDTLPNPVVFVPENLIKDIKVLSSDKSVESIIKEKINSLEDS